MPHAGKLTNPDDTEYIINVEELIRRSYCTAGILTAVAQHKNALKEASTTTAPLNLRGKQLDAANFEVVLTKHMQGVSELDVSANSIKVSLVRHLASLVASHCRQCLAGRGYHLTLQQGQSR